MNNIFIKYTYLNLFFSCLIIGQSWHSDIDHRPRTLFITNDLSSIQDRLNIEPYHTMWHNSFGENQSIYNNARREIDQTLNTLSNPKSSLDKRCWVAKDAAFVYSMNRKADGITALDDNTDNENPWARNEYLNHSINYLETLDPIVIGPNDLTDLESHGPMINNWQYRVRELISYCQAYDMLLGSGMEVNEIIETNLSNFANNLLDRYTATEYTNQYLLQRNNHKLTIGAALGMAAIVLNNNNNATTWANAGMLLIDWVCFGEPANGFDGYNLIDNDGGYAEGTHYMHYSWKKVAPFFIAMKNFNGDWSENYSSSGIEGFYPDYASSTDLNLQSPYFDSRYSAIYEWAMQLRMPDGTLPVMEDSPLNVYTPELALLSSEYDIQYNTSVDEGDAPPISRRLSDLKSDYIASGNYNYGLDNIQLESFVFMPEAGSAVFRSPDNLGLYLHINGKNGHTRMAAAAHDQADVSHFEIAFGNQKLSVEGGYAGWNYRYDVNKAENHNIILVNGFGPKPPSGPAVAVTYSGFPPVVNIDFNTGEPSPVDGFLENPFESLSFSYLECRSEYGQTYFRNTDEESMEGQEIWYHDDNDNTNVEFKRCILFVDNQYFVMLDKIDSDNNDINTYSWRFHANAGGNTGGTLIENSYGGIISSSGDDMANLLIHTTTPMDNPILSYPISQHSKDILGPSYYEDHIVIQADQDGIDTEFLTIFYPFMNNDVSIYSFETSSDYIGLLVDRIGDKYDIVIAQNLNNQLDIEGFMTVNGDSIPDIQTTANFILISLERDLQINQNNVRTFGNDDSGDNVISINGINYDLVTDPILSNDKNKNQLPGKFSLHQNYPNPFNPNTMIKYDLPKQNFVKITIHDILGRHIKTLVNAVQKEGYKSIQWDAKNDNGKLVPAGMYFYKIETDMFIQTKKMVLLK